jgi:PAS domain S-box-containing protein
VSDLFRQLCGDAGVGIYAARADGTIVWCNAALARMLGFDSADEAARANLDAIHASPSHRATLLEYLRTGQRIDRLAMRFRRRDGGVIDVAGSVTGVFDAGGDVVELHGFFLDVTREAEVEQRARQFHAVFLDAVDAMLILDDERRIVEANRAAAALFGRAAGEMVERSLDELMEGEAERLSAAWAELLALGEAKHTHRMLVDGRGARLVECSYRSAGQEGRHLCVACDITDRRLLEERLVQSEKVESVGRLAGGIAHDFNNLLTAILGYTELLLASRPAGDPDRADLEEIQKAGQRAAALTQQLLAYSRKQMLVPKEVDLNQTLLNLRAMLTRLIREDISLTCELAPEPAYVKIDPTQLEQVIINLVLNARDAMPGGGSIQLEVARVGRREADPPADHAGKALQYIRLRVVDNGVGIRPEVKAHLFEPFFTTKEIGKGTGLGLASVYGIVRQSEGFISVESESGRGAAFTMHFPAVDAIAAREEAPSAPPLSDGGKETILLVEDEDAVRVIIGAVLRRQGYQVLEAATARGAIEIFQQRGPEIDLLVTDVIMPEMNGPSLAQRLVAIRPELRVLFISGYADMAFEETEGPNVSFLGKPFQASTLAGKVREVLSRRRVEV